MAQFKYVFLLVLVCCWSILWAEPEKIAPSGPEKITFSNSEGQVPSKLGKVVLSKIELKVTGVYNRAALLNFLKVQEGQVFANLPTMERYLARAVNQLEGKGYYRTQHYLLQLQHDKSYLLHLWLEAKWTIYPIPLPVYNSNTGPGFRGRLIWDNFLGSLTRAQLRVDMDSQRGSTRNDWAFGFSLSGLQLSESVSSSFALSHNYQVEGSVENQQTGAEYALSFALPRFVEDISWSYNAGLAAELSYGYFNFDKRSNAGLSSGTFALVLNHGPGLQSISYHNGLEQGFALDLSNKISFRVAGSDTGVNYLGGNLSFRVFQPYFDMINFRGRFIINVAGQPQLGAVQDKVESSAYLRGVSDKYARKGFLGAALNMDMLLRVWRNDYLGEIFLGPFLDLAVVGGISSLGSIEDVLQMSAGLDISWKINSLLMRFSVGKNLFVANDIEITLGTGLFF